MEMETTIMTDRMILVRGGGDLATGVIHKLHQSGYHILILECDRPSAIRRHVAFCEAVYDGTSEVEGVVCRRIPETEIPAQCKAAGKRRNSPSDRYGGKTYPGTFAGSSDRCRSSPKKISGQTEIWHQ